ncbi:hypothetical protein DFH09DRAFT_1135196 [Mycena vulgaris]|nr:hypothetical protein DFH09DRAFT_1135196 [Mycena vulgaris]
MRSVISFAAGAILFSGLYASGASAASTPDINARACGTFGSLLCTSGSCCTGLFCSAQTVCLSCKTSGAFCDDTNVPCCSTVGTNGGPFYCASTKVCKGCLINASFCDPLVPCCSGKCNANGLCVA